MDEKLLPLICQVGQNGDKAALVTIVKTRGSTPRKAGSQMLVFLAGEIHGTIGGGCGEAEAKKWALTALDTEKSMLRTVAMDNDVAAREGMACGGEMELFIQVLK
ncbi:MAG: XshC-Cox1-family protein [Firmicutes bacterium]|nr:XshC-Cox1-family protein [Bacillota bacterium]